MAKQYKCTFKRVNGDNTGAWARTGQSKTSPSLGVLYMRNCPDGKTFYCEASGGKNNYYKLKNPTSYGLPDKTLYICLLTEYCSWVLEDTDSGSSASSSPPVNTRDESINTGNQSAIIAKQIDSSEFDDLDLTVKDVKVWSKGRAVNTSDKLDNIAKSKPSPYVKRRTYLNDYSYLQDSLKIVERNLNIGIGAKTLADLKQNMIEKFNRFRIAYPDLQLSKSFAHVFFTRPDLNLYEYQGSGHYKLIDAVANDAVYYYLDKSNQPMLRTLTKDFSSRHDFNPFLSNMAQSFELADEYIRTIEHGETFTGYKVKYGRHNIESKTAGNFSISYTDDDNYQIYKLHKAWVDYISKVYRGELSPKQEYIKNRILDYACSVYYILCGPDGSSILFWSKYTGVFPTNIPSATSSWSKGNNLRLPEYSINYEYSWKEDFNPVTLAEFNLNSAKTSTYQYISTYEPELLSTGKTFTGAPFIETNTDPAGGYSFSLRFRTT